MQFDRGTYITKERLETKERKQQQEEEEEEAAAAVAS